MKKPLALFCAILFLSSKNVFAAGETTSMWKNLNENYQEKDSIKLFSGSVSNRIYYNNTYDSDNRKNEYSDAYLKTKVAINAKLYNNLFVRSVLKFEKVSQASQSARRNQLPNGGGSKSFENKGAFIDELALNYNYKNLSLLAGKFTADFGDGWETSNGIWVNELAKGGYEHDEKLGFGAIQRFGDKNTVGEYVFSLSAFTNDRKNLDNSIITKRDSDSKDSGTAGDSRTLESYVAALDIYYDFAGKEELSYHFSYSNLEVNERQNSSNAAAFLDDQKSIAVNMNYIRPISNNFLLDGFVEYVNIENFGGNTLSTNNFLVINLTGYIFNDYFITIAKSTEQKEQYGTNGVDRYIEEISFGYDFSNLNSGLKGLSIMAGYNKRKTDDKANAIKDEAFGVMVNHKIKF